MVGTVVVVTVVVVTVVCMAVVCGAVASGLDVVENKTEKAEWEEGEESHEVNSNAIIPTQRHKPKNVFIHSILSSHGFNHNSLR